MLAYVLAFVVGLGSFSLYMAAFFFPEVHRRNDFIWSGVGLFYALVLWICADRMTGGVLLGQLAGVSLLSWLSWQLFLLRRQTAPLDQQTPVPSTDELKATFNDFSAPGKSQLTHQTSKFLGQVAGRVQGAIAVFSNRPQVVAEDVYVPPSLEEFGTAGQEAKARFARAAIVDTESIDVEIVDPVTPATGTDAAAPSTLEPSSALEPLATAAEQPIVDRGMADQSPPSAGATERSRFQGWGKKKESQPTYVRKQFREEPAGSAPPPKPESKPVYVRKQYRDPEPGSDSTPKNASAKQAGKPVYVRKQYRDPDPAQTPDSETVVSESTLVEAIATEAVGTEPMTATPALGAGTTGMAAAAAGAAKIVARMAAETPILEVAEDILPPGGGAIANLVSANPSDTNLNALGADTDLAQADPFESALPEPDLLEPGSFQAGTLETEALEFDGLEFERLEPDMIEIGTLEADFPPSNAPDLSQVAPDLSDPVLLGLGEMDSLGLDPGGLRPEQLNLDHPETGLLEIGLPETDAPEVGLPEVSRVGDDLTPELLGIVPPQVTAEDIVEELLEDISAQEEGAAPADIIAEAEKTTVAKERLEAVTPDASPFSLGDAAIADLATPDSALPPGPSFYGDVTDNSDQ